MSASGGLIDDHLVHAREHTLHGLEIETLAGDFRGLLIFAEHAQEAGGLTARFDDGALLVTLRALRDAGGFASRFGDDTVGIGLRFVLQTLAIGARGLNVTERVDDL